MAEKVLDLLEPIVLWLLGASSPDSFLPPDADYHFHFGRESMSYFENGYELYFEMLYGQGDEPSPVFLSNWNWRKSPDESVTVPPEHRAVIRDRVEKYISRWQRERPTDRFSLRWPEDEQGK